MAKGTIQLAAGVVALALVGWFFLVHQPRQVVLDRIAGDFKDPESVQFAEVVFGDNGVCGLVNAKGANGAYTGQQMFIATRDGFGVELLDPMPVLHESAEALTIRQDAWLERHRRCDAT